MEHGPRNSLPENIILKKMDLVNNAVSENEAKFVKSFIPFRHIHHQSAQKRRKSIPAAPPRLSSGRSAPSGLQARQKKMQNARRHGPRRRRLSSPLGKGPARSRPASGGSNFAQSFRRRTESINVHGSAKKPSLREAKTSGMPGVFPENLTKSGVKIPLKRCAAPANAASI